MFVDLLFLTVTARPSHASRGEIREPLRAVEPEHNWAGVAACESSGDWHANTGNSFFGGLQFTQQTWESFGGTEYAPTADLASKAQQIAVAERVLAAQGPNAWPVCHVYLQDAA